MAGDQVMIGKLYGVGVGPGDIELLTLKAARLLGEAKIIAYPEPARGESLARRIVAPLIPEHVRELPIAIPMERARSAAQSSYDKAADQIEVQLINGQDVLYLCEGDPFFYGSFMFLFQRLRKRFECIAVPGVTSLTACAAVLGRPLAARNDVLKIVPAPLPEDRLRSELASAEAAAIIKVGSHFAKVCRVLAELGLLNCAAIIEHATQGHQRVWQLDSVSGNSRPYFSTILVYVGGEPWH
jgi:precorrin-2/cobalt-factor-2 C20-methyltransferase